MLGGGGEGGGGDGGGGGGEDDGGEAGGALWRELRVYYFRRRSVLAPVRLQICQSS